MHSELFPPPHQQWCALVEEDGEVGGNLQWEVLGDYSVPDSASHLCALDRLGDAVQLAIVQCHVNHLVCVLLDAERELVAVGCGDGGDGVLGLAECGLEPLPSLCLLEACLLEVLPLGRASLGSTSTLPA